jgi:3-phenylpropionate/cinnamic acid dioxygenase small subunit
VIDLSEVETLFAEYAAAIDDKEWHLLDEVLTADVRWAMRTPRDPDLVVTGRDEVKEFLRRTRAPGTTRHVLTNFRVGASGPAATPATSYLTFYVTSENVLEVVTTGFYDGEIVQARDGDGRLRFRTLRLTLDRTPQLPGPT